LKNTIISIGLFVVLFVCLFFTDKSLVSTCNEVATKCEEIEILLNNKENDKAYTEAIDLLRFMEKEGSTASMYVNHVDYDSLINESLRLSLYIKEKEHGEALASLHVLRYGARNMKDIQKTNLKNLL